MGRCQWGSCADSPPLWVWWVRGLAEVGPRRPTGSGRCPGCSCSKRAPRWQASDLLVCPTACVAGSTFGSLKCVPGGHIWLENQALVDFLTTAPGRGSMQVRASEWASQDPRPRSGLSRSVLSSRHAKSSSRGLSGHGSKISSRGVDLSRVWCEGCPSEAPSARRRTKRQAHVDFLDSLGPPE